MEQMHRYNQRLIEELKNRQTQERARLPKIQRGEAKTRMAMFKKSLRINSTATPDQDREKIKQVNKQIILFKVNQIWTFRSATWLWCNYLEPPCTWDGRFSSAGWGYMYGMYPLVFQGRQLQGAAPSLPSPTPGLGPD